MRAGEGFAEPPNAGLRCEQLSAFLWSGRGRCGGRGRDAAQQELRPPGSAPGSAMVSPGGCTPSIRLRHSCSNLFMDTLISVHAKSRANAMCVRQR